MKIRGKILFIALPLLIVSVCLVGFSSYLLAASAVTRLAVEFLDFKALEIRNYADGQWNLLAENGMVGDEAMEEAAKAAVEQFSRGILRSDTDAIFALDRGGGLTMSAGLATPSSEERRNLLEYAAGAVREFITIEVDGKVRAAYTIPFMPFGWQIFVTEDREVFYGPVERIFRTSLYILAGAAGMAFIFLLIMAQYLTRPITAVVRAMEKIIQSGDLKEEVPVFYRDEIGELSHTFNLMLRELSGAYEQIKSYAFDAAVAQQREMKIRNVFQLYVPNDVINQVFVNPEKMLVGNNQDVAILFSDIRQFTAISERMTPEEMVSSLNRYFSIMVDIIMEKGGLVDKYIGDAIMAVFGAPVVHDDDALSSVIVGLQMMEALSVFNKKQKQLGAPEFRIGVGINYGEVTVGNIGCEKKMNYTVIGDAVNLASRLEGLTKRYYEPVLFSEGVYEQIAGKLPCRIIDKVAVKGKTQGAPILTARFSLSGMEKDAWNCHNEGIGHYYNRAFSEALPWFEKTLGLLPRDTTAQVFIDRCRRYIRNPPPADWDGVEVLTEK